MRRLVCVAALLIVSGTAAAQQDTIRPTASKGDFALLFDLGGLANLALRSFGAVTDTSELGGGFGVKYYIDDDIAIRLGLTAESRSISIPQGPDSLGLSDKLSVLRLGIAPAVLINVVTRGAVAGYLGGQVEYQILNSTREIADTSAVDIDATSNVFGAAAIIGAEWFPWQQVSISGEYRLGISMTSSERDERRSGRPAVRYESPSETAFGLRSRGAIMVAIYW